MIATKLPLPVLTVRIHMIAFDGIVKSQFACANGSSCYLSPTVYITEGDVTGAKPLTKY